jgi:DNA-directed RNA polymerase specialized sigma subunit
MRILGKGYFGDLVEINGKRKYIRHPRSNMSKKKKDKKKKHVISISPSITPELQAIADLAGVDLEVVVNTLLAWRIRLDRKKS